MADSTLTDGARKLAGLLDNGALTQDALAAQLKVTQQAVSKWCLGTSRPGADMREAIQHVTGILVSDWRTKPERARMQGVLSAPSPNVPPLPASPGPRRTLPKGRSGGHTVPEVPARPRRIARTG